MQRLLPHYTVFSFWHIFKTDSTHFMAEALHTNLPRYEPIGKHKPHKLNISIRQTINNEHTPPYKHTYKAYIYIYAIFPANVPHVAAPTSLQSSIDLLPPWVGGIFHANLCIYIDMYTYVCSTSIYFCPCVRIAYLIHATVVAHLLFLDNFARQLNFDC